MRRLVLVIATLAALTAGYSYAHAYNCYTNCTRNPLTGSQNCWTNCY
jgi:hypothetical protein